jgi:hypothetical protein
MDKFYRYQLSFPIEGDKIYKSKSINNVVKKCIYDCYRLGHNPEIVGIYDLDQKTEYKFKISKSMKGGDPNDAITILKELDDVEPESKEDEISKKLTECQKKNSQYFDIERKLKKAEEDLKKYEKEISQHKSEKEELKKILALLMAQIKEKEEKKPECPKMECPKPEEKKPECPKPEEKKLECPKPEEKKPECPKPEEKKLECPKPEAKKLECSKKDELSNLEIIIDGENLENGIDLFNGINVYSNNLRNIKPCNRFERKKVSCTIS